jgi:PAS domain S-box-containing protein
MAESPLTSPNFEHELRQSQESLKFALQSGRMGTWDVDLENNSISCSQEMLDLWGVSNSEDQNSRATFQKKVHPDDLDHMKALIDNAITKYTIYELEYRIQPKPGEWRWVLSRGRCTCDANSTAPTHLSGVVYDITDRKMKEEALAAAARARDQFLLIAGHELKTPLTILQLQLQVAQWKVKHKYPEAFTQEIIEDDLRKHREQVLRITRIIDNMLDASKINEGRLLLQLEDFDLRDMVNNVLELFKLTAESAGVEVKLHAPNSLSGKWDRFRLEQVLLNLLINALRYGNKKPVTVEVTKMGNNALLIVRDQGLGIKAEDQPKVFNRFEGTISENEVSGIGLGLFISQNIARAHNGEIQVKSQLDKGSEFTVILPI